MRKKISYLVFLVFWVQQRERERERETDRERKRMMEINFGYTVISLKGRQLPLIWTAKKILGFLEIFENLFPGTIFRNNFSGHNFMELISRPAFWDGQNTILDLVLKNGNGKIKMFKTDHVV